MAETLISENKRFVNFRGLTYLCTMRLTTTEERREVSPTTDTQMESLHGLIARLHEKNVTLDGLLTQGTIVRGENCRLDSQSNTSGRRANLQFQIGSKTHAVNVIHAFPEDPELQNIRIDDKSIGFSIKKILGYVQDGLDNSAKRRSYTHIRWRIERSRRWRPNDIEQYTSMYLKDVFRVDVKLKGKIIGKAGGKFTVREFAKLGGEVGGEGLLKKIPIAGFVVGCIFSLYRISNGDYVGAAEDIASGIASIPGVGTATSLAIDAALLFKDFTEVDEVEFDVEPVAA